MTHNGTFIEGEEVISSAGFMAYPSMVLQVFCAECPEFATINDVSMLDRTLIAEGWFHHVEDDFDLCPDCAKQYNQ